MVLMLLLLGLVNLWFTANVPKLILVARQHSIPPSVILGRVLVRLAHDAKRQLKRDIGFDRPRMLPHTAAAVWAHRLDPRGASLSDVPQAVQLIAASVFGELSIAGVFPQSNCDTGGIQTHVAISLQT